MSALMKNLICKIKGHKYTTTPMVLSFNFTNSGDDVWREITMVQNTTICSRCGMLPAIPEVNIGDKNTGIKYAATFSIDNLRMHYPPLEETE